MKLNSALLSLASRNLRRYKTFVKAHKTIMPRVFGINMTQVRRRHSPNDFARLSRLPSRVDSEFIDDLALERFPFDQTFLLPLTSCYSTGGFPIQPGCHPWVEYFSNPLMLEIFYREFQPKDIFSQHFLLRTTSHEVPICHVNQRPLRKAFSDETYLKNLHSLKIEAPHQFAGPATKSDIHYHSKILDSVYKSIAKYGMDRQLNKPVPTGSFIRFRDEFVFFLNDGNHRCAALSALSRGSASTTFELQKDAVPVIYVENIRGPLQEIFASYFDTKVLAKRRQFVTALSTSEMELI